MLKGIADYLSRHALHTAAAHLKRQADSILDYWGQSLAADLPRLAVLTPVIRRQGDLSLGLLLEMIEPASAKERDAYFDIAVAIGRAAATHYLAEQMALEEILHALSLFRGAVLREYNLLLRRRFWLAIPADVLVARGKINEAIDLQMMAIAQAYLQARDEVLNQKQLELEATNEQLLQLHDLSKAVTSSLNLGEALDSVVVAVAKFLDARVCAIALVDGSSGELRVDPKHGYRGIDPESVSRFSTSAATAIGAEVFLTGSLRMISDVDEQTGPHLCDWPQIGSILCAPLRAQDNKTLGIIYAADPRARHFSSGATKMLVTLANHAAIALDNAQLYEDAKHQTEVLSTLVQEMHHRIKNNLHTVVDLLTLQGQQQACAAADKCLGDSVGRVKSIAAVHELLSADNISQTDIRQLSTRLADIAVRSKVRNGQKVNVIVQGASFYLPSRQATCLALVLNELLDNAVEHAFPQGRDGEIVISLAEDGADIVISVSDNGVGLPPGFSPKASNGLGLAIASNLVEKDLMGTFTMNVVSGTRATVRFRKQIAGTVLAKLFVEGA